MRRVSVRFIGISTVVLGVAACAVPQQTAVAPPPPPPAKVELAAPNEYYFNMVLPVRNEDGTFVTPNTGIGPVDQLFHFRSAVNVAALSCRTMAGMNMVEDYNLFLKKWKNTLAKAN
ncbi:MAG: hypothetical protein AAGD40_05885, partial [Pseudomonadota bacterium]